MNEIDRIDLRVAEAVRAACVEAAASAYEDAGIRGLCGEGRWEAAVGAIRGLDVADVVRATLVARDVSDVGPTGEDAR